MKISDFLLSRSQDWLFFVGVNSNNYGVILSDATIGISIELAGYRENFTI